MSRLEGGLNDESERERGFDRARARCVGVPYSIGSSSLNALERPEVGDSRNLSLCLSLATP